MTEKVLETYDVPMDQLKFVQEEKLLKQLAYVGGKSAFYQKKFQDAGFTVDDIRSFEDFQKLPFTEKNELRDSQRLQPPLGYHAAVGMEDVIRVHSSSGTTGRPTYVGITKKDYDMWNDMMVRVLETHGITKNSVVVFAMGLSFFVGSSMKDAIEKLGATFIPIGTGASDRVVRSIQDMKADVLFCTPSYAGYLAEYIRENYNMEPKELGIKIMSVGGEPGGGLKEVRSKIEADWGCKVMEAMGNADMVPVLFSECQERDGMHFIGSDTVICEIIDPETGEPVPFRDKMEGELVYTSIDRECVPLVRFRTRDLVQVNTTPCACGRTSFRMKCIGRTDDMLILKGVNVFPSAIKDVVSSFSPKTTGEIRIVLEERPPLVKTALPIKVEYSGPQNEEQLQKLKHEIEAELRSKLIFTSNVQLVAEGTLPRFEMKANLFERLYE
jgi:phenylacetate-CoA ligase